MPGPYAHLCFAGELLADDELPPTTQARIRRRQGEFLLGAMAPDLEMVGGPPGGEMQLHKRGPDHVKRPHPKKLFKKYPSLARPQDYGSRRAAFLYGYASHLYLDAAWSDTVKPHYMAHIVSAGAAEARAWRLDYRLLQVHLDRVCRPLLPPEWPDRLRAARPGRWLPIGVRKKHLLRLRDRLIFVLEQPQAEPMLEFVEKNSGFERPEIEERLAQGQEAILRGLEFSREGLFREARRRLRPYLSRP